MSRKRSLIVSLETWVVKVLLNFVSLQNFRVLLEANVNKNPTPSGVGVSEWIDREIKRLTRSAQISELRLLQDVDPETKDKLVAYLKNRIAMLDEQHQNRLVDYEICDPNINEQITLANECNELAKRANTLRQIHTQITKH